MYATRAQMEDAYGVDQIAMLSSRDGEADADTIDRALQDASTFVESYIGNRYSLPLKADAPALVRPTIDIACYYLAQRATILTEEIENRYKQARGYLQDIASGKAGLGFDRDGDGQSERGAQVITYGGPARQFSRQTLRDLG